MSTIVTRVGKGSPLTWTEVDSNFTNLNTDKLQSGDTAASLTITSATINGGTITGITDLAVADGGTGLSSLTAGYIPFGAGTSAFGSSANLFWDSANNRLGIGTNSPGNILTIVGASGGGANAVIQAENSSAWVAQRSTNDTSPPGFNARKTRGTIASPTAVNSGDGVGTIQFQAYGGTNYRNIGVITGAVTTYTSDTNISGFLTFSTNAGSTSATEKMRIDSSGNVLVGTTSNASSAAKIMVSSTAPQMAIDGNGAGVNSLINWTTSGTTKAQTYFDATNTRFYIACNNSGGVYLASGGTSWTSASDERVKDIIEPITDAANKVSTLRAVIGKYKTDEEGTRRSFLIAQDVQAVLPEAVDATNTESLGVQYTDVIPLLVAAIKEQQTIINDLKARIETLEGK